MRRFIFIIASILYILLLTNSMFRYYIEIPNTIYPLIISITCLLLYPPSFFNKSFYSFLFYGLILLIYFLSGHGINTIGYGGSDLNKLMIELAFLLPSISLIAIINYTNDIKLLKTLTIFSIGAIFISFVIIFPIIFSNNNLLREAGALINMGTQTERMSYSKTGLPSYSILHSYIIIFPVCIGLVLNSKGLKKTFWIAFTLLLIYIIIKSSITTILLIATLTTLIIILYKPKKHNINLITFSLLGIFFLFLLSTDIIPLFFDTLGNVFSGTAYEGKMLDFKILFIEGSMEGNIGGRQNYLMHSLFGFLSNPLIGSDQVGGHSTILDHLAATGILGFVPFFFILYFQYITSKKIIPNKFLIYFNLGWISAIILLFFKGLFGLEGFFMLFFLLPGLSLLNKQENKVSISNIL